VTSLMFEAYDRLSANRLPVEHSSEEIKAKEGKRDPFLYNPRLRAAEAGKVSIIHIGGSFS
jgi:hypothetical protein